ncbi:Ca(2+)-dependent cysteine protease [Ceratobasidium sp. 428]|nr:Ca(2+)-dependent cysteine protease [Ceratobasidium sp. 428]
MGRIFSPFPLERAQPTAHADEQTPFKEQFSAGKWNIDVHRAGTNTMKSKRRALVITASYKMRFPPSPLTGPYDDALKIINILTGRFGYLESEICVLADVPSRASRPDPAREPTQANVEKGLEWLCKDSKAGDFRFLYFAGHAVRRTDMSGLSHEGIMPTDATFRPFSTCEDCVCEAEKVAFIMPTQERVIDHPQTIIWSYVRESVLLFPSAGSLSLLNSKSTTYWPGILLTGLPLPRFLMQYSNSGGALRNALAPHWKATIDPSIRGAAGRSVATTELEAFNSLAPPPTPEEPLDGNYLCLPKQLDMSEEVLVLKPAPPPLRPRSAVASASKSSTSETETDGLSQYKPACLPPVESGPNIRTFAPNCRVLCWAACRDVQCAVQSDLEWRFTHVFTEVLMRNQPIAYNELSKNIQEIFEQQISRPTGTPMFHSPRLYTSTNMGRSDNSRSILEDEIDL